MATSGSTNFTATRDQIIRGAALNVKAVSVGVTMSSEMLTDFAFSLNAMVKGWQESGIHVWTEKEATLFPVSGQKSYAMGAGATDRITETYTQTALTADEALGQSVLPVASVSGISVNDNIGVQLDDGTYQWTTVMAVGASTITLATPLTDSASSGAVVFAYTSVIVRPLQILDLRRWNIASQSDTPLGPPVSRSDYMNQARKDSTGIITMGWYDQQTVTGRLYVWQPPDVVQDLVKFTWCKPIQDFDNSADEADLPQGWINTLIWNLALEMTARFPVSDSIYNRIVKHAEDTFDQVSSFDREAGSVFFQPARR